MMFTTHRRPALAAAAVSCVALAMAGCSSKSASPSSSAGASSTGATSASPTGTSSSSGATGAADCSTFSKWTGHQGTTVTAYSTITDTEADALNKSFDAFTKCTGITVKYTGSQEFETQIKVLVEGGNPPDLALFPQPGLMAQYKAKLIPASAAVNTLVKEGWGDSTVGFGSIGGTLYATPYDSNVKSLVWYSPKFFKDNNYTIPTTWDEMITLTDKIAADHTDFKPWCAGVGSDAATGWPATDWLEDVMLRTQPISVYNDWIAHKIPFNDPKVAAALDKVGGILKNDKYVNGDLGGVDSIATTAFKDAGLGVAKNPPTCALHRQASFYAANFLAANKDLKIAPDGDVFAFYLPPIDPAQGKPVLGGGTFVAAFSDKPEVQAVREYMGTADYATNRVKLGGGFVSGRKGVPLDAFNTDVDKLSAKILQDPNSKFGFDASDLMPGVVGSGTEWKQLTSWLTGKSTKD
ncbi:MAG: alpha-glucoside transport system substrate-binding protein, partial [Frankiaceae bacterium]|nr:alpha-glucoside transport system substrate-binding protein [Frankiaceae bacterium]